MPSVAIAPYTPADLPLLSAHCPALAAALEKEKETQEPAADGHYRQLFLVRAENELVGTVGLYQHTGYIVSAGPEIFPPYRRRGYAAAAVTLVLARAKERGFRLAQAQVRTDNEASIRLHEKLGFLRSWEHVVNRHGNEVIIFSKIL